MHRDPHTLRSKDTEKAKLRNLRSLKRLRQLRRMQEEERMESAVPVRRLAWGRSEADQARDLRRIEGPVVHGQAASLGIAHQDHAHRR